MQFFRPSIDVVKPILKAAGLPTDDLPEQLDGFLACGDPTRPDGVVGLQIFSTDALLRSLVVAETVRERGIGRKLVAAAEGLAVQRGVSRVFLLTDTAEGFFAALGYRSVDRQVAPEPIRNSRQFSELCPASAALMLREIGGPAACID